jgi:hypothetical protein
LHLSVHLWPRSSTPAADRDRLRAVYPWSILRASVPHRFSTSEEPDMVRVLITVEPRMYREAIAIAVQRSRPESEVMLVPESVLDGQVDGFGPHVLVRNDTDAAVPEKLLKSVVCRVEVLFTDGLAARVSVGDRTFEIDDACIDDLLALVDEAEAIAPGHSAEG